MACLGVLPARSAPPYAAMMFQRAPPDVNGFGVTTWTPDSSRSLHVRMCLGFPLRTTKTTKHGAEANAFVKFLYTKQAQTIFAQTGYRPVLKSVAKNAGFTNPKQLFAIGYVGGWPRVEKKFFDPNSSVMATIERSLGG